MVRPASKRGVSVNSYSNGAGYLGDKARAHHDLRLLADGTAHAVLPRGVATYRNPSLDWGVGASAVAILRVAVCHTRGRRRRQRREPGPLASQPTQ
jgi:hypothetical protein